MKLLFKYRCGHEKMRDIDGRRAANRSVINTSRNKIYDAPRDCPDCSSSAATAKIDALNEAQLRELVHSLSSNRYVRDALSRYSTQPVFPSGS